VRRTISIVVAAVLAVVVVVTIVVAVAGGGGSIKKSLKTVRGAIGSEKKAFFDDPRVKQAFADHGLDVQVDTAGSRAIATTFDLSKYDFAFPAGTPAAEKIKADRKINTSYVPFVTPMAIATFKDIAQLLEKAGVAHDRGGFWTLDIKAYLDLVKRNVRWTELPGNTSYPATKFVLVTSTDISTSNSAAMYASIASYVANGDNVVSSPHDVDQVAPTVSPLFLKQGYTEQSSEAPFDDYLTIGEGATPMVMIYEGQYVARAAAHDGSIDPTRNVLMYPDPDLVSKHTLVPLTPAGDEVGRLLTDDPVLQQLAVENGFRITSKPGAFNTFVKQAQVTVQPNLLNVIEPPTYDNLEALIQRVEASLKATLGPRPQSGTESTTVPARNAGTQTTGSP
jgi:hypothetical protein